MIRRALCAVAGLGLLAGWTTSVPAGAAAFPGAFSTVAAADGVRQSLIVPGAPLSTSVVDVGAPSVQAAVDSLGSSRAFASLPYPGETAATGSGLVRTLSGLPVPDYPLYVHSSHPIVPQQEVAAGPYAIKAASTEAASKATATGGAAAPGQAAIGLVRSEASAEAAAAAVMAVARSNVETFTVGPLRLGQVLSTASVTLDNGGKRSQQAETRVVAAMVGETAVTLTAAGLAVGGSNQPVPALDPVRETLGKAGVTVALMPGESKPNGVVAPTIRITQRQQSGAEMIYVLGGASAFVDGAVSPLPDPVGAIPTDGAGSPPGLSAGDVSPVTPEDTVASDPAAIGEVASAAPFGRSASAVAPSGPVATEPTTGAGETGSQAGGEPPAGARSTGPERVAAERLASELLGLQADAGPLYGALAAGGLVVLLAVGAARWWRWRTR